MIRVRLISGLNEREGIVEVTRGNTVGIICDDDWDAKDSGVVCNMLGFGYERSFKLGIVPLIRF